MIGFLHRKSRRLWSFGERTRISWMVLGEVKFPFWELGGVLGYPPPPSDLWNQRVSGKTRNNLWGSSSYGQNLDPQGVSSDTTARARTATALVRICCSDSESLGLGSHRDVILRGHGREVTRSRRRPRKRKTAPNLRPSQVLVHPVKVTSIITRRQSAINRLLAINNRAPVRAVS